MTQNEFKNPCFQNILKITCKNESGKSAFTRVSKGQGRNEESPLEGIDTENSEHSPQHKQ